MPSLPNPIKSSPRRAANRGTGSPAATAADDDQQRIDINQARYDVVSDDGLRWINIEDPSPVETGWLEHEFGFHALNLEDVLSRNQRPKIDEYPDYLFIALHFPVFDRNIGRLNSGELDIFVGRDFLVTIPNQTLKPVSYLFDRNRTSAEIREKHFRRGPGYLLYRLIDDSFDYCFPMLRKIGNKLDAIEDAIFADPTEDNVRAISNVKQEIISFRRVIRPQRTVLQDLEKTKHHFLASEEDEIEIYFDDIVDAHERIWDVLESYKEVVEALEHTNESLISKRNENAMRVLTSIATVALPLTFFASLWGMNVKVPWEGEMTGFWIIVASMILLLVPTLMYFRRKGWL